MTTRLRSRRPAGLVMALLGVFLLLGAALGLEPDARGHATHEQLGLPPCTFLAGSDIPCPTCGVTTAFTLLAHGRPIDAARTQAFGALLGLLALAAPVLYVAGFAVAALDPAEILGRVGLLRFAAALAAAAAAAWALRFLG